MNIVAIVRRFLDILAEVLNRFRQARINRITAKALDIRKEIDENTKRMQSDLQNRRIDSLRDELDSIESKLDVLLHRQNGKDHPSS